MTDEHPDVERGSMFGMPILKAGRKAFASWYDGALVLKLGEPDLTAAALAYVR
ncbi:MAG: hypothetical protein HGA44_05490 [Cellulomonadaceae bacterium]|nr:hypothetical protein [Cellulomonadaceae bacterium]